MLIGLGFSYCTSTWDAGEKIKLIGLEQSSLTPGAEVVSKR